MILIFIIFFSSFIIYTRRRCSLNGEYYTTQCPKINSIDSHSKNNFSLFKKSFTLKTIVHVSIPYPMIYSVIVTTAVLVSDLCFIRKYIIFVHAYCKLHFDTFYKI